MAMKIGTLPAVVPQVYEHEQFGKIRVVTIDGEVKFVGTDAATALGYANPQKALRDHVPAHFKRAERIVHPSGGAQNTILIDEQGLYRLAFRSKLPEAERFTDWAAEIMVSVRKTGSYTLPEADPRAIFTPTYIRQIADRIESLENQVAELKPKADYCEAVLESDEHLTSELIAKEYGKPAQWLHEKLRDLKKMYKRGRNWHMYQPYAGEGYRDSETVTLARGKTVMNYYWTQKGRNFIYNTLKEQGIVPVVEREDPATPLF